MYDLGEYNLKLKEGTRLFSVFYQCLSKGGCKKKKQQPDFSVVTTERTRGKGQKLKPKKKLFNCEGGQTPKQIAQRSCRVSILRGIQNLTGQSPGQTALAVPSDFNYSVIL